MPSALDEEEEEDSRSRGEGGTEEWLSFPGRNSTCSQLCGGSFSCGAASFSCPAQLECLQCCKNFIVLQMCSGLCEGSWQRGGSMTEMGQKSLGEECFSREASCSQGFVWFLCALSPHSPW